MDHQCWRCQTIGPPKILGEPTILTEKDKLAIKQLEAAKRLLDRPKTA